LDKRWPIRPTLQLTRVNRKYCEITGYAAEELVGKSFLEITHPDDRDRQL